MRFAFASSLVAGAWVVAALVSPDTNFFLFPLFVAMAIPITQRIAAGRQVPQPLALAMGTAGFVNAALTTLVLSFTGNLEGEPLGWLGSTLTEGVLLGLVGGVLGAAIARTSIET